MDLRAGERWEQYQLERLLAETHMSRVWLARDSEENRLVALKTIRRFAENEDLVEAARFGAVLQQMLYGCDQRVVEVHRHADTDGHYLIDMEYVEGKDVSQVLAERGRIDPEKAVRIALELAEMLDNLHNFRTTIDGRAVVSAVHGDLKPKNIRIMGDLDGEFKVKVLDFGTAKALSQSKPGGTRTAAWSPAYASPELLDRREMNPLSDRWALGATLYEMVTGRVPFGAGKSIEEMENQIRSRPHMPDLDLPDCPAALHAILSKLLDPEPERRYQSAGELCLDLRNYPAMPSVAGYQGETVRSEGPPIDTGATRRSTVAAPVRSAQAPTPPRRAAAPASPRTNLIRLAIVIAAICLGLWLIVRETRAVKAARQLESELTMEKISVDDARERFLELRSRRMVWIPTTQIARLLTAGLIAQGDTIATKFRSAGVRQAEWKRARAYFEQARDYNPGDKGVRGRLRLCDAHLERYRAQFEKNPNLLDEAEESFRESAQMLRDSPDPWLGMAMLALYNQKDPEKGEQALREARSRTYDFTVENRWVSLLADAYRLRADTLAWEAQRIARTLPDQARERLQRAMRYDQKAVEWYSKIPLYGSSLRDIERCRYAIERMQQWIDMLRAQ
jgi:serine/threonine protein kinase